LECGHWIFGTTKIDADTRLCCHTRGRDGGIRQKLVAGMNKKRRTYLPRIVGVLMPADLKRLHKYMLEVEHISVISDEMREVVKSYGPSWHTSCRRRGRND
jgi:hypothetical protein